MRDPWHTCSWTCKVWCFLHFHRWEAPGEACVCCGRKDEFFEERRRMRWLKAIEKRTFKRK